MSNRAAADQILARFFAGLNDADPAQDQVLVDLFRHSQIGVLPYRRGQHESWYGFATDAQRARELQREVLAFVGPSWTTWSGETYSPDLREPIDGVVAAVARGPVIRLEPVSGSEASVRSSLHLMAQLLLRRPQLEFREPRPRHRLLSELELAFASGNVGRARELISEIANTGTLGALNLLFLDFRLRDVAGETDAILDDPSLPDLVRRRRPHGVTRGIVRALQARHLLPLEERWRGGDSSAATAALDSFQQVSADFQALFLDPFIAAEGEFLPAVVTHYLLRGQRDPAERLLGSASESQAAWPRALIAASAPAEERVEREVPAAVGDPVRTAFEEGAYEVVLDRAEDDVSSTVLDFVVRAAYNLDTLSAARRAVASVDRAETDVLRLLRSDRTFREAEQVLRALTFDVPVDGAPQAVDSWRRWFVAVAGNPRFPTALEVAERGRYEWSTSALSDERAIEELASAILDCANSADAGATAVGALPYLLDWLQGFDSRVQVAPILGAALDLLLYAADPSDDRDSLSVRLFGEVAEARANVGEIANRLQEFAELWKDVAAPMRLDWPLALLDVAVDFAGRAAQVKEFFAYVLASISQWRERIDDSHEQVLRSLAEDLGEEDAVLAVLGEPSIAPAGSDPLSSLAGKAIGIYSLTPGVRSRVVRVLEARCPTATVEVNADLVSTEQLRALAARADLMVVAFQSAKHAATDAIVAVRGRHGLVPAAGKGSAGVLRALEDWAAEQSSAS